MKIITGRQEISPCPFCKKDDRTLKVLEHVGSCYGSCGYVSLERLYELMLLPRTINSGKEATHAQS
jgi:hypothetical protein